MCSFFVFGCSHIVKCLFPFTRKVGEFLVVGSLTVTWCNSLSSVAVVRCLDRSSLEEQGFILVCCSRRVQPVMVRKHGDRQGRCGGRRRKLAGYILSVFKKQNRR